MKAIHSIHEQLSIKLWPITISMKNCQFPNTTFRTLGIFTDTCVEMKRKNKVSMWTCTYESFSRNRIIAFMGSFLTISGQSLLRCKNASFLTQRIGLWVFLMDIEWDWRKGCGNKARVHAQVDLTNANRCIHEQHLEIDLQSTFLGKKCQFPWHTKYKGFWIFWWIFVHDGKEKLKEYGKTCIFLFFSLMARCLLHWAPTASTARPRLSVHFLALRLGHRHAHESVLQGAPIIIIIIISNKIKKVHKNTSNYNRHDF